MIGNNRDIVITINHSLDEYSIEFIQQIEAEMDKALGRLGFSRSTTNKGSDKVELVYWQFGQAFKSSRDEGEKS